MEKRNIYGIRSTVYQELETGAADLELNYGWGLRYDDINGNELSHTINRKTTIEQFAYGDVDETNLYGFIDAAFDYGHWLFNPGIRLDYFGFDYVDKIPNTYLSLSE